MQGNLARLAGAALGCLAIAVLGSAGGVPAASAASPSVGVPGLPNVYQSRKNATCLDANTCTISFAKVPLGTVLKATHLNCVTGISGSSTRASFLLFFDVLAEGAVLNQFLVEEDSVGGYTLNEPILTFINQDRIPSMQISGNFSDTPDMFPFCILSGELLPR